MNNTTINGALLKEMFLTGAALLEKNKAYVDSLNVFPVPDGDTGTNMSMTMQSAVKEIKACNGGSPVGEVAAAASLGALKGARGNSGVILSQIFRGFAKALKGCEEMDAELLANALRMGTESAYKAVMKPKEGTILTVSRMISTAVEGEFNQGANVFGLIDVMIESGEEALRQVVQSGQVDVVVNALVGYVGLMPTIAADAGVAACAQGSGRGGQRRQGSYDHIPRL